MEGENIHDKLQDFLGNLPESYNILEEQIPIELQMKYFEYSKRIKQQIEDEKEMVLENTGILFDEQTDIEQKKDILVKLASIDEAEAFRAIEKYLREAEEELKYWALLALQESKMLLESSLLDENRVFISTGLGGKGSKLRYFIVLITKEDKPFSDVQQKIIKNEFEFVLSKYQGEIEEIDFEGPISTLLTLVPIEGSIKEIFMHAIQECNQYGDFIKDNFIITNVKKLSPGEIQSFIKKNPDL